jgi:hypothetical protein
MVEIDDETKGIKCKWGYWGKLKLPNEKVADYAQNV